MADSTKHLHFNIGTIVSDIKNMFSMLKTRKTVAFAYGFMFAFVAFTVFLAFNPSSNSSSPWFTNIFSSTSTTSPSSDDPYRSQFSSIFSYFFPNSHSQHLNANSTRSNNNTQSSGVIGEDKVLEGNNKTSSLSVQNGSSSNNNTLEAPSVNKESFKNQSSINNHTVEAPSVNEGSFKNQSSSSNNTVEAPSVNKGSFKNQSSSSHNTVEAPSVNKGGFKNQYSTNSSTAKVIEASQAGNVTGKTESSKEKNAGKSGTNNNVTSSGGSVKQGMEDLVKSLVNCDLFDGHWVRDDSYPLYKPGSCSVIDDQFKCITNGRPDKKYQMMKWKPKGCTLPRIDGSHLLEMIRGKRLVFVGDSLNRNMWESLICILENSVKDRSKVYEASGRVHFRGEASYRFIFEDYNCTVEFFVSPFLVREWETPDENGKEKETLRLDLVGKSSNMYKDADFIIFNTGHWWTHDKTSKGKDYYQEGSHIYGELNVLEAFRKALTTWARWIDANVNPAKSMVFFRGYSASHFSGGQWNSGGACDHETEPIKNDTYLNQYPDKMMVLERVLRGMKTHVTYLNITRLTDYRKDGHPSIYRKGKSGLQFQDCAHWCLPGVPDAWNELFYAELLVKHYQKKP